MLKLTQIAAILSRKKISSFRYSKIPLDCESWRTQTFPCGFGAKNEERVFRVAKTKNPLPRSFFASKRLLRRPGAHTPTKLLSDTELESELKWPGLCLKKKQTKSSLNVLLCMNYKLPSTRKLVNSAISVHL